MVLTTDQLPRLVFVMSPWQNAFFREIAEVLVDEIRRAGSSAEIVTEPETHIVEDADVFVLMPPHEYVTLEGGALVDDPSIASRTIGISAEQPHQVFFTANAQIGAVLGAVVDFSAMAVAAYREHGVAAVHMPFGYTPMWDTFESVPVPTGPPRVLYFGNKRPRRLRVLAEHADVLERQSARLLVSDNSSPNMTTSPTFLAGRDKRSLLSSTRLLVNIHQGDEPYFEWLRFCEAAMAGTPYLTERSEHCEPWVAGEHFAVFDRTGLGAAIDALVGDDAELQRLRSAAYAAVRERPLVDSISVLLDSARERVASSPPPKALPRRTRTEPLVGPRPDVSPGSLRAQLGLHVRPGRSSRWPLWVRRSRPRRLPGGEVLVAPRGTEFIGDGLTRLLAALHESGADLATGVAVARDRSGGVILEGVWPWETWRLLDGQDLGKVMVVRGAAWDAAREWRRDRAWRAVPHLAVALSVADRGGRGTHVPTPLARYPLR